MIYCSICYNSSKCNYRPLGYNQLLTIIFTKSHQGKNNNQLKQYINYVIKH
jgi:hypothetical protein